MEQIPFPNKKYQIIYADPPWQFKNYNDSKATKFVGNIYPVLTTNDICKLPISKIADDNCALLIWATFPKLLDCFKVIESWGFQYKTNAFTWIKKNKSGKGLFMGMGYYTRSNAEICLLAIKGNPLKRISHSIHSVVVTPREEHSKKPDEVRRRIINLFGDISRIELFARQKTEGWDVWGQ